MKVKEYSKLRMIMLTAMFVAAISAALPAASVILNATGDISGKTQDWNGYGNITADDPAEADTAVNGANLYTLFETSAALGGITDVRLHIKHYETGTLTGSDQIGSNISNDLGTNWSDGIGGWNSANESLSIGNALMSNAVTDSGASIYPLFPSCSWADVNNIGAVFRTSSVNFTHSYANWAYLEVVYNQYTATATITETDTITPTPTESPEASGTDTPTVTDTITETSTDTYTVTVTDTETITQTPTETETDTVSPTVTETHTFTYTNTDTPEYSPTDSPSVTETVTITVTGTVTPTVTETGTQTVTQTETQTVTQTVTATVTQTITPTETDTEMFTATNTQTITETVTATVTGTVTGTVTETSSETITKTTTETVTESVTASVTRTITDTSTATVTGTVTQTVTQTITCTVTRTITMTITPTITATITGTITPTVTESETGTHTASRTITETHTVSPTSTNSPAGTLTSTPSKTPISTGEGTAIINPAVAAAGTSGNTHVITYTNGPNTWGNGVLKLIIPLGWSAPSLVSTDPGYYKVSVSGGTYAGTGKSGQTITVNCNNLAANAGGTITITYGSKADGGTGAVIPAGTGIVTFRVEMNPVGGTTYEIASSPQVSVVNPTPTASSTRTYTASPTITQTHTVSPTVTPTNTPVTGEGTASVMPISVLTGSTGNTFVFIYSAGPSSWANSPGNGTLRITIPTGWSAPSTTSTAPGYFTATCQNGTINGILALGNDIVITAYGLAANIGKITVTYGDKTGVPSGPGVAVPGIPGSYEFIVKSQTSGAATNKIGDCPFITVAAATATATRTVTPTYTITPDATPVKPAALTSLQSGNSMTLSWNTSALTNYYKIYSATGAGARNNLFPSAWTLIATVLPTPVTSSFTHTESAQDYISYLVTGVNGGGEGGPSTMSSKIKFAFTAGRTYRPALPYQTKYAKASDIVMDIEGSMGTANKISQLLLWNPLTQTSFVYAYSGGSWKGSDWTVDAGTSSSNAIYFVAMSSFNWVVGGSDKTTPLIFYHNTGISNSNKRILPYGSKYLKVSDIIADIEGNTYSGVKINTLMKWEPVSGAYIVRFFDVNKWKGPDFDINPGDMLNFYINQSFTWTPRPAITPVP